MIQIRQETEADYKLVEAVIEAAFKEVSMSDHTEHLLVHRLRSSHAFIPALSLVALFEEEVVGHIILTKIKIKQVAQSFDALALAPVSVHPNFQKKGIGASLIQAAHKKAAALGHGAVILLGHADYYPRFGYKKASLYQIKLPFEAPDENCMALELRPGALEQVAGIVEYDPAFYA